MRRLLLPALLLLGVLPAHAQSLAARLGDLRATAAVRAALAQDPQTRPYDVGVTTRDGVVTLVGVVGSAAARDRAEALAREAGGVRAVQNTLRLEGQAAAPAPTPTSDTAAASDEGEEEEPAAPPAAAPEAEPPAAEPEASSPRPVYHTVGRGDTLYSIARRYGTTVQALQRLNDLRGTDIRLGQRLRVR